MNDGKIKLAVNCSMLFFLAYLIGFRFTSVVFLGILGIFDYIQFNKECKCSSQRIAVTMHTSLKVMKGNAQNLI